MAKRKTKTKSKPKAKQKKSATKPKSKAPAKKSKTKSKPAKKTKPNTNPKAAKKPKPKTKSNAAKKSEPKTKPTAAPKKRRASVEPVQPPPPVKAEAIEVVNDIVDLAGPLSRDEALRTIYALLFASDRPLSAGRIAEAVGDIDPDIVATLLSELAAHIEAAPDRPYALREIAGGYQLTTHAEYATSIRRMFQIKRQNKLSKVVLETLAIIAYRQPVTRPDVESIRGVSVSHAFNTLQEHKLIKAVGVADQPGRPRLYRTTDEFLLHFGLNSLKEMPSIEELREMA